MNNKRQIYAYNFIFHNSIYEQVYRIKVCKLPKNQQSTKLDNLQDMVKVAMKCFVRITKFNYQQIIDQSELCISFHRLQKQIYTNLIFCLLQSLQFEQMAKKQNSASKSPAKPSATKQSAAKVNNSSAKKSASNAKRSNTPVKSAQKPVVASLVAPVIASTPIKASTPAKQSAIKASGVKASANKNTKTKAIVKSLKKTPTKSVKQTPVKSNKKSAVKSSKKSAAKSSEKSASK